MNAHVCVPGLLVTAIRHLDGRVAYSCTGIVRDVDLNGEHAIVTCLTTAGMVSDVLGFRVLDLEEEHRVGWIAASRRYARDREIRRAVAEATGLSDFKVDQILCVYETVGVSKAMVDRVLDVYNLKVEASLEGS